MDELELPNIREAIESGKDTVILKNLTKGTEMELEPVLTERQRGLVLAGGLLNYTLSLIHILPISITSSSVFIAKVWKRSGVMCEFSVTNWVMRVWIR